MERAYTRAMSGESSHSGDEWREVYTRAMSGESLYSGDEWRVIEV